MNNEQYLVVVSGPSGSGKDTVVSRLMARHPEIEISVSATTRDKRPGEQEGVNYYYLTVPAFEQKIADGEILEYTQYCGNYYGTPKSEVDRRIAAHTTVILVIEVVGATNIKRLYPGATTIFIQPPSVEELRRRLENRGTDAPEVIESRVAKAEYELGFAKRFDKVIVNERLETAQEEALETIRTFLNT